MIRRCAEKKDHNSTNISYGIVPLSKLGIMEIKSLSNSQTLFLGHRAPLKILNIGDSGHSVTLKPFLDIFMNLCSNIK